MTRKLTSVKPSQLPTKTVKSSDGTWVRMKVVKAESETLGEDLLAAFRSNVRGIVEERRKRA